MSMYNFDMFGINSDRSVSISTLLGVARDDTMIIIYIFSLFLTFQYVSNFSTIRGFLISWVFPVIFYFIGFILSNPNILCGGWVVLKLYLN